ncbi:MAG: hypothetical protein M3R07_04655 [Gemmatimonadota bacterium]|nr:hypothetical protein [Gemmatimonadota bacterium]
MQLRQRLQGQPETLSDFAAAAEQKYWEAIELAACGHRGGGIYLMGYAAEMYLKVSAFRFDGASLADLIEPRLAPARNWLKAQPTSVAHESYHSVLFWMAYLRGRRVAKHHALPTELDGQLVHRVRRIYSVWWVEMRYRPDQATPIEVERLFRDVT